MKRMIMFLMFSVPGCGALEHELARAPEPWMTCEWAVATDYHHNVVNRLGGSGVRYRWRDVFCRGHVDPTALPLPIDVRRADRPEKR